MSAALIDLVSVGVQDIHITGSPEVSFFRQTWKRYTNFAMKPERMDYIGTFSSGGEVVIPVRSKGDLLSYVWIESDGIASVQDDASDNGFFKRSATDLTEFSLYIGGQMVCTMDSLFIQGVHNPLLRESAAKASFAVSLNHRKENHGGNYYAIPFFFSEEWSKALPLLALSYHEVEIRIKCRSGFSPSTTPKVFGNYIYLDTDERKFFTDREHEILITQTQNQRFAATDKTVDITYFNHHARVCTWCRGTPRMLLGITLRTGSSLVPPVSTSTVLPSSKTRPTCTTTMWLRSSTPPTCQTTSSTIWRLSNGHSASPCRSRSPQEVLTSVASTPLSSLSVHPRTETIIIACTP